MLKVKPYKINFLNMIVACKGVMAIDVLLLLMRHPPVALPAPLSCGCYEQSSFFGVAWAAKYLFNRDTPPSMVLFIFFPGFMADLIVFPAVR